MKKNFLFGLFATAMLLLTTACQKEADLGLNTGEDGLVTINLSTPEMATRTYSDGTMATRLQYAVYDAEGKYLPALTVTDATINLKTKVELQLTTGNQYTLVFWAGAPTAPYTVDFANKKMTVDYPADLVSNREDLDAFYRDTTFTVTGRMSVDLHLYRPFAQLNIGTSDLAESAAAGYDVKEAAVTTRAYKQFNFITRTVDQAEDVTFGLNTLPTEAFPVAGYDYVAMNYILMTNDKGVNPTVTLTYTDGNNEKTRTFTNIPLQRNYRTNIFGQLFTSDVDVNVEIIPVYDNQKNPDNVIYVNNEKDLSAALTSTDKNIHVILGSDIDLPITSLGSQTPGSGEYKLAGEETENIIIDLNQKKLNITTNYWSGIGAKNANATVTIKNGTMTSSQKTGTWNSYDVTFANCNYVLDNVVFSKSIAFTNAGKNVTLNNVTINETHDYYAMWISAKGQNVTIDGLTINAPAGRGIKIDEQYVDAPSKVTMVAKNATFTTAKKAAIVVKSAAGADITLENVNLAGVAADNVNAVWVDEDAAAYAGEVTVTGGTMIVESDMVSIKTV
ncbi:MAG: right-handed parallel beta-helix repeat-containing protein [Bacteroidaceae bacterium]|nr:right-handed parallel beta-helix repeat-containing protein [Bacteroidaceae bacterium]